MQMSLIWFCSIFVTGFLFVNSEAAPTSLLEVIFSGSAIPEAKHLIYKGTPIGWILAARNYGKIARQNLSQAFEIEGQNSAEKLTLYAEYLNKCSFVDQKFIKELFDGEEGNSIEMASQGNVAVKLATTIGLDSMTANLFGMNLAERRRTIGSTCARNELRLQCALGFYRNRMDKLKEHIEMIKEQDGVFKVMLESECQMVATNGGQIDETIEREEEEEDNSEDRLNSIFQCVHLRGEMLAENCAATLAAYNESRIGTNLRIRGTFEEAVNLLDRRLQRAAENEGDEENGQKVQRALRNGQSFLRRTLTQLADLEAPKCRRFNEMVQCISTNIQQKCGQQNAEKLETMLKIGYLRRERGDILDTQFAEMSIQSDVACPSAAEGENEPR